MLLDAAGVFNGAATTELIDGEIIGTRAHSVRHGFAKSLLAMRLADALDSMANGLAVLAGVTVAMEPHDAPHPDIVVTSEPDGDGFAPVATVALLVEVADITQKCYLCRKAFVYARGRVPDYWVVDLTANVVVRHWHPDTAGYAEIDRVRIGSPVESVTIAGLVVATGGLSALPEKEYASRQFRVVLWWLGDGQRSGAAVAKQPSKVRQG